MTMPRDKTLTLKISPEEFAKLEERAAREGTTVSDIARTAMFDEALSASERAELRRQLLKMAEKLDGKRKAKR